MRLGMKLDVGQVVLLPFPHTNLKAGKKRPALILTGQDYNKDALDVVLAYVTGLDDKLVRYGPPYVKAVQ